MTASIAALSVLQKGGVLDLSKHARLVAGHSAGEYAALCAAGAFNLSDTARLLRTRGLAMQDAAPVGEGAMSALLGIEMHLVEEACQEASEAGIVVVANDNAPGQIVISGAAKAVEKANEIAKKKGAKRAIPLNVSTPNHSPLLKPAAAKMREALARIAIRPNVVPLVSNVTAAEVAEPDLIRTLLVEQLTARVRWRESVAGFRPLGVAMTVEMGGNKVLTGMVKRIDKDLEPVRWIRQPISRLLRRRCDSRLAKASDDVRLERQDGLGDRRLRRDWRRNRKRASRARRTRRAFGHAPRGPGDAPRRAWRARVRGHLQSCRQGLC
jgi:[acyl-carrier-protein] S-malonyltransferase